MRAQGGLAVGLACLVAYELGIESADAVGAAPLLCALTAVGVALGLLYPDARASNTAYTETCAFCGLYLGAVAAGGAGGRPALEGAARRHSALAEFCVGLAALGAFRQALSSLAKRAVRALPRGRASDAAEVSRHLVVTAAAGWWVFALHPSQLLRWALDP